MVVTSAAQKGIKDFLRNREPPSHYKVGKHTLYNPLCLSIPFWEEILVKKQRFYIFVGCPHPANKKETCRNAIAHFNQKTYKN